MYDTPFQFMVLEESGIQSVADIAGKRVGAGPRSGTSGTYIPEFFKTLGIEATLSYGDWSELAAQMQARQLDVLAVAAGVPFPSFAELETRNKVRYIPLAPDQIVALDLAMPELEPSTIPAGSYPSLRSAYPTIGMYNLAVAHQSLPNDLVYSIIRAVFTYQDEMMAAHPAAASTVPANFTRNNFLPFHPGAVRYYQEIGVSGVAISD
jgi:TRAP transporter TAXI family solute receptor